MFFPQFLCFSSFSIYSLDILTVFKSVLKISNMAKYISYKLHFLKGTVSNPVKKIVHFHFFSFLSTKAQSIKACNLLSNFKYSSEECFIQILMISTQT